MHNIFGTVINNTMNTSILILAVILARLLLRKSPKFIICIMWGLVGIKLICPFSVESMFSFVPDGSSFLVQSEKSEIYNKKIIIKFRNIFLKDMPVTHC